tara:strand:- start:349 stop:807 length:459 start_codon:yes stop_codon:yes gene_type:complete
MVNKRNDYFLRKVIGTDEQLLLDWSNDLETRKWSFNSDKIIPSEHKVWFKTKLNDKNIIMRIFEYNNVPAGLVRLENNNNKVKLNYLIAPEERGKGLASIMLKMVMSDVENYWQNIVVLAFTLPKNIASIKSLQKAGFKLKKSSSEKNCYVY